MRLVSHRAEADGAIGLGAVPGGGAGVSICAQRSWEETR